MAVTVLIEWNCVEAEEVAAGVALQYRGSYSQRGKQPWPFLAGRSHDDSERFRILSDTVWSLPRPHSWTSIGPSLNSAWGIMVEGIGYHSERERK
jgi:hypothetical protein